MRRWFFPLALLVLLFTAPSLFACEECIPRGTEDEDGIVKLYTRCRVESTSQYEGCIAYDWGCDLWSYGTTCPSEGSGGPGGPGGGGGGGGTGCTRDASGSCPPECTSCGGGFLL
ncbi:MAG TPA: hypothetical protein VGF48_14085 [Thermoanaerobaculia bacterium]|jgi:hypothetical protein